MKEPKLFTLIKKNRFLNWLIFGNGMLWVIGFFALHRLFLAGVEWGAGKYDLASRDFLVFIWMVLYLCMAFLTKSYQSMLDDLLNVSKEQLSMITDMLRTMDKFIRRSPERKEVN